MQPGRPITSESIVKLVVETKHANKRWGCRKINGELRKLGIRPGKSKIAEILKEAGFTPSDRKFDQTWLKFLKAHTNRYFACDFMTVETLFFKRLYLFTTMDVSTRAIELVGVTSQPNRAWLENLIRTNFYLRSDLPNFMISDRDGIYGDWFKGFLSEYFDIRLFRTPPRSPNCNAHIERWHRTLREEVLGRKDLERVVSQFIDYYHYNRPHQGLDQDSPRQSHKVTATKSAPKIERTAIADGLIINFEIAA